MRRALVNWRTVTTKYPPPATVKPHLQPPSGKTSEVDQEGVAGDERR
jgi:hypothetical protein